MTIAYGDTEPEDAWDADDAFPLLADNLFRRLALLEGERARDTRQALLDIIDHRLARFRRARGGLSERDKLRLDQLDVDLAFLRGRVT